MAFARGKDVFASVGADGSVRMFDLRSLEHSTIIYESPNLDPLLRLEWNKQDPNYLATFMVDSRRTIILDIRVPSLPVAELGGHLGCVNATAWAPHSSCHICTAGDDAQALIWDLSQMPKRPVDDPILAYNADGEINNLQWSTSQPDWISIAYSDKLQICKCLDMEVRWYAIAFILFSDKIIFFSTRLIQCTKIAVYTQSRLLLYRHFVILCMLCENAASSRDAVVPFSIRVVWIPNSRN